MKNEKKQSSTLFSKIVGGLLIFYCVCIFILLVWALMATTKTAENFDKNSLLPDIPMDTENYTTLFQIFYAPIGALKTYNMWQQFFHSALYSGGGALLQTACTAIVAYCAAKYKGWFSTFFNSLVILTIALPIVGNTPSMLNVLNVLHLDDQSGNGLLGMWIMKFGFINVYYFIFYAAFKGISWDYAEAAFLDGATHFGVFFKIMVPMVMSLCGTIFLLFFISYWNDYQAPLLYWGSHPTIAYGLQQFMNGTLSTYEGIAITVPRRIVAGIVVALPMIAVFIIFRNKLMSNLSEGGIKG